MSISAEEVQRIAELAELGVEPGQVGELAAEMGRILEYVAQLAALPEQSGVKPLVAGPEMAPLRDDVVRPPTLTLRLAELAPEFHGGLFLVPRPPAVGGSEP